MADVWVLGGHQSDFARNLTREGKGLADLTEELVLGALDASGAAPGDMEVIHVANAFGELFCGQAHLGAMPATVVPDLWGRPSSRHEAACASGSIAILAAMADLAAGNYDAALVLGVELEKTVTGDDAARHMASAAWVGHEGVGATFMWPHMFDKVAGEYDRRYGLDDVHLRAISDLNLTNAKRNPNAQTRSWTTTDDAGNPIVEGRLRRSDCSQVTDGGTGLVLVNDAYLRAHPSAVARVMARIEGWGHRTVGLPLDQKLQHDAGNPYVLPHVREAVLDAFRRARTDLETVDGMEVHDCFTPSEYLAIDHVGLTGPGESWKAIENGEIEPGGSLPINPSGGLIGGGHPVGATGVRMLLDAAKQVAGSAGDYQVEGAQRFATLNIGGSTATTVSFVVAAAGRG